jgi:hypothetical protein
MLRKLCLLSSLLLALAVTTLAQDSRHFTFHYDFTVKNLPPGKKIRIWNSGSAVGCVSGSEGRFSSRQYAAGKGARVQIRQ